MPGKTQTTTTTAQPWHEAAPYIKAGLSQVGEMWEKDPSQFAIQPWQGEYIAPEAKEQTRAYNLTKAQTSPQMDMLLNAQGGVDTAMNRALGNQKANAFQTAINQNMNAGLSNPFQRAIGANISGGPNSFATGQFRSVANQAQRDPGFGGQWNDATARGFDPRFNQSTVQHDAPGFGGYLGKGAQDGWAPGVGSATAARQGPGGFGGYLDKGAQGGWAKGFGQATQQVKGTGGFGGYLHKGAKHKLADPFRKATNAATTDMLGQGMREHIAQNVAESVMPHVNAAFGNAGMTGGGLHAAAAAKGVTSAMAPVELEAANRAMDRGLQAGMARQTALEGAQARQLAAADMFNQAKRASRGQNLQAAGMRQSAMEDARNRQIQAAGMVNAGNLATRGMNLQGAGLRQGAMENARARELQAGGMINAAEAANRAQNLQAGQARQAALEAARGRALDAGQTYNAAEAANRALQLNAGNQMLGAWDAFRDRQLRAGGMHEAARGDMLDRRLGAGTAAQNALMDNRADALRAAGMAPAMSEATYRPISHLRDVGDARAEKDQQRLSAEILHDQQAQQVPLDQVSNYLQMVSGLGSAFGSRTSSGGSNPGILGLLGGGLQGAALLEMLSDRRAKDNIRRVGQTDNGLPVYVFTYKGDARPQLGVMAQDVEKVRPEAVFERPDGMKMVHYGMID